MAPNPSPSVANQLSWEADNSGIEVVLQQCWASIAPPRFHFLAWLSYLGRLKTAAKLLSLGDFAESKRRAWSIWCDILSDWGIIWVAPNYVKETIGGPGV
ncbi:hypothetical protein Acr_21g0004170 [Actinidia rufa]|uniref:Reverse transcriptase zinc-binding domain-containing protein n=1 Tax=Actinidia rufa TaxID=165716 RepID=A0A7J0GGI1_9ERIC|nr:hypothetical protein Acr_21g0004170 [Actinidia rufa]